MVIEGDDKHQRYKQQCFSLCWELPDAAQSFVFRSQIATNHEEEFNAMVLLVFTINMIGMLLNTKHLPEGHKNMQH